MTVFPISGETLRRFCQQLQQTVFSSKLARGASLAFLLQVTGVALTYLLHVLLARWMGASGYGGYAYVIAWASLASTAGALGLPLAALRFLSQYQAHEQWDLLRGAVRGFLGLACAGSMIVALVGAVGTAAFGDLTTKAWLGWILVPLLALLAMETEMARALGTVATSLVPPRILRPAFTLAAVAMGFHILGRTSPEMALAATIGALGLAVLAQLALVLRAVPVSARTAPPELRLAQWLRVSLPLLVAAGFSLLLTQLDILMVGWFLTDRHVGLYSAAAKTSALVTFVLFSINVAAAPRFTELHVRERHDDLQRLVSKVAKWAFWPSLGLAVLLGLLAAPILSFFGDEFTTARWELRILVSGYVFSAAVGSVGYLLNLTGHERHNARTLMQASLLAVGLDLLTVPRFGTLGAAWSTTATWVFVGLRLHHLTARHVGVNASVASTWMETTSPEEPKP